MSTPRFNLSRVSGPGAFDAGRYNLGASTPDFQAQPTRSSYLEEPAMATRQTALPALGTAPMVGRVQPMNVQPSVLPNRFQNFLGSLKGMGQQAGAGAGEQIKSASGLDVANAALGIAGGLSFLGAKKPQIDRPATFSSVAPVQHYEADRQQGYNQVAHNASTAMNSVRSQMGADWSAYASAALGVNAQSNNAVNQINSGIGQQKRQDNINMAQQLTKDREFNYTTQRSFDEAQYNQQMDAYKGQRTQGAGMMQSSLNYMVGKDAANRQFAEQQKAADQQITGTAFENALRYAPSTEARNGVLDQAKKTLPGFDKFFQFKIN